MEGARTNPAWPPAGSGCHGSLNVRPSALPSSASLLWAPSSPLCWVTWASASHRIRSRAGVGSQTWHLGSFLIWGLQPGGSLSTPNLQFPHQKSGDSQAHLAVRLLQAALSRGPCPLPAPGTVRGSHLAGILLAVAVASAQHAGCHLVAVGLAAQVLRDQLHVHLLQAVAGGACPAGLRAKVRGSEVPGAPSLLLAVPFISQEHLPRPALPSLPSPPSPSLMLCSGSFSKWLVGTAPPTHPPGPVSSGSPPPPPRA